MVNQDANARTFDCEPTLTDSQVLDFCRDGYLILPGVVDEETNQRTLAYLNGDLTPNPRHLPEGFTKADVDRLQTSREPSPIIL